MATDDPLAQHRWKPGQSGNPGGVRKEDREREATVRDLARSHTEAAIAALVEVMQSKKSATAARVSAAIALLDRGYGRPAQQVNLEATLRPADVSSDPLTQDEWTRMYGELGSARPS